MLCISSNFPYAGFIENGSLKYIGSFGYYWSRTTSSNTGTYDLFFYSSNVDPTDLNARYNGYSIRCVATTQIVYGLRVVRGMD